MIDSTEAYRSRHLSHEELISKIQPNDTLAFGSWMGQPHGFMRSLAKASSKLEPLFVITTPGIWRWRITQSSPTSFASPGSWDRSNERPNASSAMCFTPQLNMPMLTRLYVQIRLQTMSSFAAAPMDERGYFNLVPFLELDKRRLKIFFPQFC
jgi:acyl-CoA hydrolase